MTVLKGRGRYIAMTGDGVNDILPVRTADVGVAMQSGSPATRGVADLVLVRDDFSILPEAIRDGQRIVAAMAATLTVLLARTKPLYVLLIIVGAAILDLPFPFTPRQTRSSRSSRSAFVPIVVLALWVRPGPSRAGLLKADAADLDPAVPRRRRGRPAGLCGLALQRCVGRGRRTILTTLGAKLPGDRCSGPDPDCGGREARPAPDAGVGPSLAARRLAGRCLSRRAVDTGRPIVLSARPASVGIVATLLVIAATWTAAVIAIHHTRIVQRGIDALIAGWQRRPQRRRRIAVHSRG